MELSFAEHKKQHIVFLLLLLIFKLANRRRWWVKLDSDVTVLVAALDRLRWLKADQVPVDHEMLAPLVNLAETGTSAAVSPLLAH